MTHLPGSRSRLARASSPNYPFFLAVAFVLALTAFGLGQLVPGLGVLFTIVASTLWVAYNVRGDTNSALLDRR